MWETGRAWIRKEVASTHKAVLQNLYFIGATERERERERDEKWLSVRLHGLPDVALPGSWLIPIQLLLIFSHVFPEHFLLREGTVAMAPLGTLAIDAFFMRKVFLLIHI